MKTLYLFQYNQNLIYPTKQIQIIHHIYQLLVFIIHQTLVLCKSSTKHHDYTISQKDLFFRILKVPKKS